MGNVIKVLEKETGINCFETFRRCLDRERGSLLEYDNFTHEFMREQGETTRYSGARNIRDVSLNWAQRPPAINLFMDGSRHTYKIIDIPIGSQVFPVVAAQVGVAACKRINKRLTPAEHINHIVLAFPDKFDSEGKNAKQHRAFLQDLMQRLKLAKIWYI